MTTRLILRRDGKPVPAPSLAAALGLPPGAPVLFLCPHDDDAVIGAGMLVARCAEEGLAVHVGIASDGRMGYCDLRQRAAIARIRKAETRRSYAGLGVPSGRVRFLGLPDGALYQAIGRRRAGRGESAVCGHTGLQNHLTHLFRAVRPAAIFTPASTDLHPDHQAVYKDLLISIFHASGDIWPELGAPIELPAVYEYPVYVRLERDPDAMLEGDVALFEKKLAAIAAYASQKQISALVERVRAAGPVEFFRNIRFALYDPEAYKGLFRPARRGRRA